MRVPKLLLTNQREPGECDVVGGRYSGRKCQHRNEMRGPDSKASRNRRNSEPGSPHIGAGPAYMVEHVDGRKRGHRADYGCQAYEPQVMFVGNTIKHSVHVVLSKRRLILHKGSLRRRDMDLSNLNLSFTKTL